MNELRVSSHIAIFQNFLDELEQSIEQGFILPLGHAADLSNIRRKSLDIMCPFHQKGAPPE